ncbi:hypothetical protein HGRIS_004123 [Hohenbuehelia grisea]|uniref:Uncharacterized protein n=1 Tax=Hohenbuehelia grisea TaxID=104357 RepID=A0ABR3JI14_9AGAR
MSHMEHALAVEPPVSSVNFPSSDSADKVASPTAYTRPPYLPFRRISLPSAPSIMHRDSVYSVASFDSLPEEDRPQPSPPPPSAFPGAPRTSNGQQRLKRRPMSVDGLKRPRRREVQSRVVDEAQETKRRKIIDEFYETERAYVDGLELIYTHFLTPIIESLDTPEPLLDRASLTAIFSNFIDIWNLHRSFLSALTSLLTSSVTSPSSSSVTLLSSSPPPLSPILLSHFPYLSLYTPFVTAFPSTVATLNNLASPTTGTAPNASYNPVFASFIASREADPRCGKLKLRDWLLTIVQRCPRYLLLLKDLIGSTDPEDAEHAQLTAAHNLVSKITLSLNTSLHTHAQTLALLALQRATPNLPFQLIAPGRTLLKRGRLFQVERSSYPREREFLLFSDCLVWLAAEESDRPWRVAWNGFAAPNVVSSQFSRPPMSRTRSKSEAELSSVHARDAVASTAARESQIPPPSPSRAAPRSALTKPYAHPIPSVIKRQPSAAGGAEERWVYKGHTNLVDLEIIVSPLHEDDEERRFEVLSPGGSFVLYAAGEQERDQWTSSIRQAKSQMLVSLNVTHPHSTLTSSASTAHVRHSLQALPFPPSDERIATIRGNSLGRKKGSKFKDKKSKPTERRGKVEHWVPAIWIPDEKTEGCMRCTKPFGWRRRRHHCRLCGRCVCAACSERTFFISDPKAKEATKPARACNACYETVFPLLDPPDEREELASPLTDTMNTLSAIPLLVSLQPEQPPPTPHALMAIDQHPRRPSHDESAGSDSPTTPVDRHRLRVRTQSRPRSYHQILEDFQHHQNASADDDNTPGYSPVSLIRGDGEDTQLAPVHEGSESSSGGRHCPIDLTSSSPPTPPTTHLVPRRHEDTVRRHARFSMPAVALQTTNVTTHTQPDDGGDAGLLESTASSAGAGAAAPRSRPGMRARRFSLVLGSRPHTSDGRRSSETFSQDDDAKGRTELGRSLAAGKLSELLGRRRP